jgi:hypothetical protein
MGSVFVMPGNLVISRWVFDIFSSLLLTHIECTLISSHNNNNSVVYYVTHNTHSFLHFSFLSPVHTHIPLALYHTRASARTHTHTHTHTHTIRNSHILPSYQFHHYHTLASARANFLPSWLVCSRCFFALYRNTSITVTINSIFYRFLEWD